MARSYKFALLRLSASAPRDERLNVGIAVLKDGRLDVHLPRSLTKLNALSLAFDLDSVRASAAGLNDLDQCVSDETTPFEERIQRLKEFAAFDFSPVAEFVADTDGMYHEQIQTVLKSFVDPEPALKKPNSGKNTKLTAALRNAFRSDRILAAKDEDLNAHRVVTNVELGTGLIADFVLKNGAMHVIETVDASSDAVAGIRAVKDIALSALTIEQARIAYGGDVTVGRLVYQASAQVEALATSALQAAEHQNIEIINWASADDQRKLLTTIATYAVPMPRKKSDLHPLNASAQRRFDIN